MRAEHRRLKARAQSAPWNRSIQILLRHGNAVGVDITLQEVDDALMVEPTMELDPEDAQTLMDDLWNCGIRPTEGAGSAGAMRATEKHLDDMRRIVFDSE